MPRGRSRRTIHLVSRRKSLSERHEDASEVLRQARTGDPAAREMLLQLCLPLLRRFAHGRLPERLRGVMDTDDLVQIALMRMVGRLERFVDRGPGSMMAYLRSIMLNEVRDQARRLAFEPSLTQDATLYVGQSSDPLDQIIGKQSAEIYTRALAQLPRAYQEAIVRRIELGQSYREIALAMRRASANAARLLTTRALVRLVERMRSALREPPR